MPETTKQRLVRAASNLMGMQELSMRMKVAEAKVEAWAAGDDMTDKALMQLSKVLDDWSRKGK